MYQSLDAAAVKNRSPEELTSSSVISCHNMYHCVCLPPLYAFFHLDEFQKVYKNRQAHGFPFSIVDQPSSIHAELRSYVPTWLPSHTSELR